MSEKYGVVVRYFNIVCRRTPSGFVQVLVIPYGKDQFQLPYENLRTRDSLPYEVLNRSIGKCAQDDHLIEQVSCLLSQMELFNCDGNMIQPVFWVTPTADFNCEIRGAKWVTYDEVCEGENEYIQIREKTNCGRLLKKAILRAGEIFAEQTILGR